MSAQGLGCVKTRFISEFPRDLHDFKNLQFDKALISLRSKFMALRQNKNFNSSPTFSHGLGQKQRQNQTPALLRRLPPERVEEFVMQASEKPRCMSTQTTASPQNTDAENTMKSTRLDDCQHGLPAAHPTTMRQLRQY
jgi:hypothetical protein